MDPHNLEHQLFPAALAIRVSLGRVNGGQDKDEDDDVDRGGREGRGAVMICDVTLEGVATTLGIQRVLLLYQSQRQLKS